jgi:hypothetical protein
LPINGFLMVLYLIGPDRHRFLALAGPVPPEPLQTMRGGQLWFRLLFPPDLIYSKGEAGKGDKGAG